MELALAEPDGPADVGDAAAGTQEANDLRDHLEGSIGDGDPLAILGECLEGSARMRTRRDDPGEPTGVGRAPDRIERHPLIAQRMGRDAEDGRAHAGREAQADHRPGALRREDVCSGVGTGDNKFAIAAPDQVHAAVRQDPDIARRRLTPPDGGALQPRPTFLVHEPSMARITGSDPRSPTSGPRRICRAGPSSCGPFPGSRVSGSFRPSGRTGPSCRRPARPRS